MIESLTNINIIDIVLILLLVMGTIIGFKRGAITSIVNLIGVIVIVVIAYLLKNPVASLLFNVFPFFKFDSSILGPVVLNVLLFELIAFLIVSSILFGIFKYVLYVTKIIEKLMKLTIVLGILSKIIGAFIGFVQYVIVCFILLFILNLPIFNMKEVKSSSIANKILIKTPFFSGILEKPMNTIKELDPLLKTYKDKNNNAYNLKAMDIMLETKILTVNSADVIVKRDKVDINGLDKIIDKHRRK